MRRGFLLLTILYCSSYIFAQNNVVDKIIAIVGEEIILKSDIENEFLHEQGQVSYPQAVITGLKF